MLSLDPAVLDKLRSEFTFEADLIEMVNLNYYWTNADTDLYYNSNRFISIPMEIEQSVSSPGLTVDLVEVRLANADDVFTSIFLNNDQLGQEVLLYKYFEKDTVALYLRCFVENFNLNGNTFNLSLTTEFALWKKKTMRYPTPSCQWPFKVSAECGYMGSETWCDQTAGRCKALGNYANFGGRKYISSIEGKKIYWGEEPQE